MKAMLIQLVVLIVTSTLVVKAGQALHQAWLHHTATDLERWLEYQEYRLGKDS